MKIFSHRFTYCNIAGERIKHNLMFFLCIQLYGLCNVYSKANYSKLIFNAHKVKIIVIIIDYYAL